MNKPFLALAGRGVLSPLAGNRMYVKAGFCLPLAALLIASLAGCSAGPDYIKPAPPAGIAFADFKETGSWKTASPAGVDISSKWWTLYGDAVLNGLVEQANAANQSLRQAEAQYRQALSLVDTAQAGFYPTVGVAAAPNRARASSNGVYSINNTHSFVLQSSWVPDLWGRVSRQVEAANASAQASAADLAAARLVIQATVVNNYLQLRLADRQQQIYARTLEGYEKALKLTQSQFRSGVVTRSDVALANSTLKAAQALAIDTRLTREQLEHSLAVLMGKTPSEFSVAALPTDAALPAIPPIPAGIPSALLERRPDISGAERRMAAANANIGVAQSAWFPSLTLGASAGNAGVGLTTWFAAPQTIWAVGGTLAATLFDGGLRSAQNAQARAAFDGAAATYKQTVLAGLQEVEDNLVALRELDAELQAQNEAVASAKESERILLAQYRAGTATYQAVITAQTLALTNERTALQLLGRQMAASVTLIKALGGGWNTSQIPADAQAQAAVANAEAGTPPQPVHTAHSK